MKPHLHDAIGHLGVTFLVEGTLDYRLADRVLRLAFLTGGSEPRYLEIPTGDLVDRVLLFAEIAALDITPPAPTEIYHHGESFLLELSGAAEVTVAGNVPGRASGPCTLWRYRAAGGRFLQIESWAGVVHMLEGTSVHQSMIEVRPATQATHHG